MAAEKPQNIRGIQINANKPVGVNAKPTSLEEIQYTGGLSLDQSLARAENETMADEPELDYTTFRKE